MLASENPKPEAIAFQKLMIETNNILNQQARLKHDYFSKGSLYNEIAHLKN